MSTSTSWVVSRDTLEHYDTPSDFVSWLDRPMDAEPHLGCNADLANCSLMFKLRSDYTSGWKAKDEIASKLGSEQSTGYRLLGYTEDGGVAVLRRHNFNDTVDDLMIPLDEFERLFWLD